MSKNEAVPMTTNRPYLLRAIYDWISDNNLTPYVLVDAGFAVAPSDWLRPVPAALSTARVDDDDDLQESNLTDREQDVLRLVAAGARNREIAAKLSISPNTVKFHVSNLLRKLGARSRAELASLAR